MTRPCRTPRWSPCWTTRVGAERRGYLPVTHRRVHDHRRRPVRTSRPTSTTLTGGVTTPYGATGALVTQGGGIYVHDNVRSLQVTDNVIRGNSGSLRRRRPRRHALHRRQPATRPGRSPATRSATTAAPTSPAASGSSPAATATRSTDNAICGNFSAEYGGAITAFGYNANAVRTAGGSITNNRIWFNASYDEGGGVMVAGELPADPTQLSARLGPGRPSTATSSRPTSPTTTAAASGCCRSSGSHVSRINPGTITITNNTIANNVSAHEGGGIALDDAAFVNIVDNTVARNLTTATAVTSDGRRGAGRAVDGGQQRPAAGPAAQRPRFPGSRPSRHAVQQADAARQRLLGQPRRQLQRRLRLRHRRHAARRHRRRRRQLGHGRGRRPGALLTPTSSVIAARTTDVDGRPATNRSPTPPGSRTRTTLTVNVLASRTYPAFRQAVDGRRAAAARA